MSGAELCGKSSGDRGTQRVGLSLCPLSQSADLRPCVYRGPKKPDFPGGTDQDAEGCGHLGMFILEKREDRRITISSLQVFMEFP